MKKYFCVFCVFFASTLFAQEWQSSYADAQMEAKDQNKSILLVFAGSDWCTPCIKLHKMLWQSEVFRAHAQTNYVLYKADFPRKKVNRLPDDIAAQNKALAEMYNPKGYFPLVLVLNSEGRVLGTTGYPKSSVQAYIEQLNSFLK